MPGARDAVNCLPIILALKKQIKKSAENYALYYNTAYDDEWLALK